MASSCDAKLPGTSDGSPSLIRWFIVQVLHGNTALNRVSLLAGRSFTDVALCQARARLPLAAYQAVLRGLNDALVADARGTATARSWSTAPLSRCPIHRS